ncbi:hypothetical protein ANO14919_058630 [Xylariales sp. No.14919]|nr:hypothetical protein ANO14919_058630 [Xylariales sp. No.14919]
MEQFTALLVYNQATDYDPASQYVNAMLEKDRISYHHGPSRTTPSSAEHPSRHLTDRAATR